MNKKEREITKKIIQEEILEWFLFKYTHLDEYDIRGTVGREIRNDAENCADRIVDKI